MIPLFHFDSIHAPCPQSTDTTPDEIIEEDRLSNISRELHALRERSMTTSSYEESKVAQGKSHFSEANTSQQLPIPGIKWHFYLKIGPFVQKMITN